MEADGHFGEDVRVDLRPVLRLPSALEIVLLDRSTPFPEASVEVVVVDPDGRALSEAVATLVRPECLEMTTRVSAATREHALRLELTAGWKGRRVDPRGRVVFTRVEDREWILGVGAPRHRARLLRVRPSPGAVRVVLEPAHVLAFRLLDGVSGRPVAARVDVRVSGAIELQEREDAHDGLLVIDDLFDEALDVTIDVPGYRVARLEGLYPHAADDVPRDVFLEPEV